MRKEGVRGANQMRERRKGNSSGRVMWRRVRLVVNIDRTEYRTRTGRRGGRERKGWMEERREGQKDIYPSFQIGRASCRERV